MLLSDYFGKGSSYSRAGEDITFGYVEEPKRHSEALIKAEVAKIRRGSKSTRRKRRSSPHWGGLVPYIIRIRS